jgi:hypothetical protein
MRRMRRMRMRRMRRERERKRETNNLDATAPTPTSAPHLPLDERREMETKGEKTRWRPLEVDLDQGYYYY